MSEQNNTEMTFQIQRIYTKDVSYEAPNAPHVFQKDWQPEVKLDLDTASTQLAEDVYEVVLRVTVTASLGEETAFLCEVQQLNLAPVNFDALFMNYLQQQAGEGTEQHQDA